MHEHVDITGHGEHGALGAITAGREYGGSAIRAYQEGDEATLLLEQGTQRRIARAELDLDRIAGLISCSLRTARAAPITAMTVFISRSASASRRPSAAVG